jgi:hypothetical protein
VVLNPFLRSGQIWDGKNAVIGLLLAFFRIFENLLTFFVNFFLQLYPYEDILSEREVVCCLQFGTGSAEEIWQTER